MLRINQKGAVLAETILVLPFLLVIIMAVVDFGRLLNTHFSASRIAYEAARFASSVPQLEKGNFTISVNSLGNYTVVENTPVGNQQRVVIRLERLMRQLNAQRELVNSVEIKTSYTDDCSDSATAAKNKAIQIDVKIPFTSLFPLVYVPDIKAHADSAYLFTGGC